MAHVHVKTLRRAVELAGGEQQLAVVLNVTASHLRLWMTGFADPPADIFLRAVDLVLGETGRPSAPAADGSAEERKPTL